ncbi:hypothetical protein HNY73_013686 [Argiope bruennichi]|uniref:Uncharacterized protein n=1 Tax=Argiope bruennichi TaxID=94029 RepID=A0A8T0EYT5_ARGBR|nr:hypothetical protein HNY73_013686 [Argiope bruennichi]
MKWKRIRTISSRLERLSFSRANSSPIDECHFLAECREESFQGCGKIDTRVGGRCQTGDYFLAAPDTQPGLLPGRFSSSSRTASLTDEDHKESGKNIDRKKLSLSRRLPSGKRLKHGKERNTIWECMTAADVCDSFFLCLYWLSFMKMSSAQLDEHIHNKTVELEMLRQEYQALLESRSCISNSETEVLNSKLYNLMAEVKYLKKCEPEILPKYDVLLYAWVQHSLEEDMKQKEKVISNLDKMLENVSKRRKLLIQKCPNSICEDLTRRMMKDAKSKNELLHCLHRKMVRRLRRLSRRFSTIPEQSEKINKSTRDITGKVLTRSFYRVLKEFVIELQDRTFKSDDWDQSLPVFIDRTYSKEHISTLCKTNIILKSVKTPSIYYLRTKHVK